MTVDLLQSLFLGVIQGVTEWLPISSSGHLALSQLLLNIQVPVFYDLVLHIGTLAGVIGFYRHDILGIFRAILFPKSMNDNSTRENRHLFLLIIIGTIPTAVIAFSLRSLFVFSFYDYLLLAIGFLITGFFVFITKFLKTGVRRINYLDAILIGIAQGFSVFSSISRSGITISIGMMRNIDHEVLIKFSFLLSIPAIFGGLLFDLLLMDSTEFSDIGKIDIASYIMGFISSAFVGYLSIKLLIKIIRKGRLHYFSYYCLALGILILIMPFFS